MTPDNRDSSADKDSDDSHIFQPFSDGFPVPPSPSPANSEGEPELEDRSSESDSESDGTYHGPVRPLRDVEISSDSEIDVDEMQMWYKRNPDEEAAEGSDWPHSGKLDS